jgi:tyrosyl-tRNA synthetase
MNYQLHESIIQKCYNLANMDKIDELLTRGVANIIPNRESLEKVLRSDKKINVYFGVDPTATRLHLGNAVGLRRLQTLVDLGHHVTFLIGDFTALIGDTSDKDSERPVLTSEQIKTNFQDYKNQASKIINFSKVKIVHNSEWLKKLNFEDIIKLCQHFSIGDFVGRELVKNRLELGKSVRLDEALYPVMQGYDSYFLDTDLQLGGTDQTFNMQAGRILQKDLRSKESFVLTGEFLEGTDGRKMSKSWGNAIWLTDEPNEMFGKIMSLKDDLVHRYFLLGTNLEQKHIPTDGHPMELKKRLAYQIVSELHSPTAANEAQKYFERTVQSGEMPEVITAVQVKSNNVIEVLVETGLASSKSEARRLIEQGGVKVNGEKVTTSDFELTTPDSILSVGSRKFVKVN